MDTPALVLLLRATATATTATPTTRSAQKTRVVYDFPAETLVRYMHLRQDEAAKALGVATITLKRICHRRQIRWPYRAYKTQMQRLARAKKLDEMKLGTALLQRAERRPGLPSYCVYSRPVSAEVPALAARPKQVQYSTQRPKLPSLTETLGLLASAYPRVPFPAKERPHLCMVSNQPLAEPAPMLPKLNVVNTTATFQSPTYATKSPRSQSPPVLSPSRPRFGLLPSIDSSRLVPRAIGHV